MKPFLDSKGNVPKNLLQNVVLKRVYTERINYLSVDGNQCRVPSRYRLAGQD
jgi:hypothetical protein